LKGVDYLFIFFVSTKSLEVSFVLLLDFFGLLKGDDTEIRDLKVLGVQQGTGVVNKVRLFFLMDSLDLCHQAL